MSLSLEKLPVFYQLLLSEIDPNQQEKINDKISNYALTTLEKSELSYYVHPENHGKFTSIQALAQSLLELRNDDQEFRSKAITRYLSFKFSLQLDLLNEWHKNEIYEFEMDYYIYFNALSLMDEKNYQQALNTIEGIIQNQRYDFNSIQISLARHMFLIDCYNLYILAHILLNNFTKAQFELSQLYFLVEKKSQDRDVYYSLLYLAKHKELLLAILQNDTNKVHQLVRGFNNAKSSIKDYYTLGLFTGLLALYYLKEKDFDRVESMLLEAGHFFRIFGTERLTADTFYNLISFKLQQGDIFGAISLFEYEKETFTNSKDIISNLKFAILFSEIFITINDIAKSYEQLNFIDDNKNNLFRIREIDYWLMLHSLAERHNHQELQEITNNRINGIFEGNNIDEKLIYVYNVRKEALVYYSRADFDNAGKKLVAEKINLANMDIKDYYFEINIDLLRIYLKQYEFSKHTVTKDKILKLFDDLSVYINSTKSFEASIFLKMSRIYFYLVTSDFALAEKEVRNLKDVLEDKRNKNKFIESLYNELDKIFNNIQRYQQNKFFFMLSDLNKYDLTESVPTFDIFVANNSATIEELWRNLFTRHSLIDISILRIQKLNKFDLKQLNVNQIPGLKPL